ncbi:uncharacterized protein LOC114915822 [Cajanus cajan]|uniref:uncharacterized protein LOC114915822 n=1 Tax=Cajanus cajan TaxID=3821 RepID=UPI0010FAF8E6|nr:uncharacterized protein LOC114915822 [Cajanus cajan]
MPLRKPTHQIPASKKCKGMVLVEASQQPQQEGHEEEVETTIPPGILELLKRNRFLNEVIVEEFYANARPLRRDPDKGEVIKKSWVRGQWVLYDRNAFNKLLGEPMVLHEGQCCSYQFIKKQQEWVSLRELNYCVYLVNLISLTSRVLHDVRGKMTKIASVWMFYWTMSLVL